MCILITGSSSGIGLATAKLFLHEGFEVIGIDIKQAQIESERYTHVIADISKKETLPELEDIDILVNNAGAQNSFDDIDINLKGTINVTEKYGIHPGIKSILMVASASAHTGAEFPFYSASKGGMLAYMRNVAIRVAQYGATCNSISPGGVLIELNRPVIEDDELWSQIMAVTPLKKWATAEEIATWIYFLTVLNQSCTGQDILIDNGEKDLNSTFIWPEK